MKQNTEVQATPGIGVGLTVFLQTTQLAQNEAMLLQKNSKEEKKGVGILGEVEWVETQNACYISTQCLKAETQ